MKNRFALCVAFLLAVAAFVVIGCSDVTDEVADETANTWYKYTSTEEIATTSTSSVEFDGKAQIYFYYDTESGLEKELKVYLIQSDSKIYVEKSYTGFSSKLWTLLYASGKLEKSSKPNIDGYTEFKGTVDWEDFLVKIITNKIISAGQSS